MSCAGMVYVWFMSVTVKPKRNSVLRTLREMNTVNEKRNQHKERTQALSSIIPIVCQLAFLSYKIGSILFLRIAT